MRPFSTTTKEMRPANRHDLLNHALHHYSLKQVLKLGSKMPNKANAVTLVQQKEQS